jgi:hypothetical protein
LRLASTAGQEWSPADEPDDNLTRVTACSTACDQAGSRGVDLGLNEPDLRVLLEIYDAGVLRQIHLLHDGESRFDEWRALGRTEGQISNSFKHLREAGYIEPIRVAVRSGTASEQRWQLTQAAIDKLVALDRWLYGRDLDRPRLRPPG